MPPFLHCVQPKILVFTIPIRHFDGRNFELGPTQWSQLHVVHVGVSRHVRGQHDVITLQMVEMDQLEEQDASNLRRLWGLVKRVGENF